MAMFVFVAALLLAVIAAVPTVEAEERCDHPLKGQTNEHGVAYPETITNEECVEYWRKQELSGKCVGPFCISDNLRYADPAVTRNTENRKKITNYPSTDNVQQRNMPAEDKKILAKNRVREVMEYPKTTEN